MLTINTSASGTSETSGRTRRAGSGETSETSGTGGRNEKAGSGEWIGWG